MNEAPAAELRPLPVRGRRYAADRRVRLGDVDAGGELRLDAVARYLQDVASDDALDADLPNALGWLVRRTMIRVVGTIRLGDRVRLTTWCTGSGRSWAERRTSLVLDGDDPGSAVVDAVSLWVQVDPASGRPARLGEAFDAIYGEAAGGRTVSSKLSLPRVPEPGAVDAGAWRFRTTDRDPFGHVNNAAQWALPEDRLGGSRRGTGELEYVAPADAGVDYRVWSDGTTTWLTGADRTVSVVRWTAA